MTSEELRDKYKKLLMVDMSEEDAIKATEVLLSLLETAITEAEPKKRNDFTEGDDNWNGQVGGYNEGVKELKSNLLALVRGEK